MTKSWNYAKENLLGRDVRKVRRETAWLRNNDRNGTKENESPSVTCWDRRTLSVRKMTISFPHNQQSETFETLWWDPLKPKVSKSQRKQGELEQETETENGETVVLREHIFQTLPKNILTALLHFRKHSSWRGRNKLRVMMTFEDNIG